MLIYRLETKSGKGVYRHVYPSKDNGYKENYSSNTRHPCPDQDSLFVRDWESKRIRWSRDHYRFGFNSPEQLFRWFFNADDFEQLEKDGLQISVYDCPEGNVIVGNTQVAFAGWHHQLFNPIKIYAPIDFYLVFTGQKENTI